MPVVMSCSCGRKLNLKDSLAGKMVKCPQCGSPLRVSGGEPAAATRPSSPPGVKKSGVPAVSKDGAGPKIAMGNFRSLDEFDDAGNLKKKTKKPGEDEHETFESGNTGGEMSKIAAEALKSTEEKPKHRCPGCGKGVKADDLICTRCGTNVRTGRRIGESGFTLTPRKLALAFAVLGISAAGGAYHFTRVPRKAPAKLTAELIEAQKSEVKAVQASLDALVRDMDPDTDRMLPHAAFLGMDALPPLAAHVISGSGLQKRKAVKLLEILAFNKYRSAESVKALGLLASDTDAAIRGSAVEALFWSAADSSQFPRYWAPGETDPAKTTDVQKLYRLPFADCRQALSKVVKEIPSSGGKVKGDAGRRTPWRDSIPAAALELKNFADHETDPTLKLSAVIQCVRAKPNALIRLLISYLEPESPPSDGSNRLPPPELGFVPPRPDRERARRCLLDVTGRTQWRWDDWVQWWRVVGQQQYPPLEVK